MIGGVSVLWSRVEAIARQLGSHALASCIRVMVFLIIVLCVCQQSGAEGRALELDRAVESLKSEVLDIQSDLLRLEEDMLYPEAARLLVYVTTAEDAAIVLEGLELVLDGHTVATHRYSRAEADSLRDGGAHRVYIGVLSRGRHELEVLMSGRDDFGTDLRSSAQITFSKGVVARSIELRLMEGATTNQPRIEFTEW